MGVNIKQILVLAVIFLVSACVPSKNPKPEIVLQPTSIPSPSIKDYFPLKRGAYWVYQGPVKWQKFNSTEIEEQVITWKMEVSRVFEQGSTVGYEMVGAPWDLDWYEDGKQPSEWGIIQAGGHYYQTSMDTIVRVMNEDDALISLVSENQLFLEIPLMAGKKFCDTLSIARSDNGYCNVVSEPKVFDASGIQGINTSEPKLEYRISIGTMPDHSVYYFVPGIGYTRYIYGHHGTISEVDVRLVEYHSGG